jgi:hypothetical protein
MRLELAGSLIRPEPLVLTFAAAATFDTLSYIEKEYTHFDVICIGGGGGIGGGIETGGGGTGIRNFGGAGGGGGFHRVRGLLSALPDTCPIVVGAGGAKGTSSVSDLGAVSDGGSGGTSSFNTDTCRASGGIGGKRVQSNSTTVTTQAHGGAGGVGNRLLPGGGAPGGTAGTPSPTGPGTEGTPGTDGTFINNVGKGGGGGAGGVGKYTGDVTCNAATAGGRGAYNPADTSVFGPGGSPEDDEAPNIRPGFAGGAKGSPLNGLPYLYGQSKNDEINSDPGIVIIRLTSE